MVDLWRQRNIFEGDVAQWLEQRAHNLLVEGSIPSSPTKNVTSLSKHNVSQDAVW